MFVDTNILLDFYRLPGASATRTLAQLEKHRGSLILTDQVWMEFLKNRQKVITQTIREFVKPVNSKTPSFLNDEQAAKTFTSHQKSYSVEGAMFAYMSRASSWMPARARPPGLPRSITPIGAAPF